jgi:hypothetical protein
MSTPDFDVVTNSFADRAAYEDALAAYRTAIATFRQDEENFLNRSKSRLIVVDEYGASSKS